MNVNDYNDPIAEAADEINRLRDEIERLKAQVKELSEAYQKAIGPIKPAGHKALITELCDALEKWADWQHQNPAEINRVIQRAREATRK